MILPAAHPGDLCDYDLGKCRDFCARLIVAVRSGESDERTLVRSSPVAGELRVVLGAWCHDVSVLSRAE